MEISKNQLHEVGIDAVVAELNNHRIRAYLPHSRTSKCHLIVRQNNHEIKLTG